MQIVTPYVELLSITPNAEQLIERCGRICYKSEDKMTPNSVGAFIRIIIGKGHHSVIEHASATILFVCDRGVTHELVRHRLVSYSQESTRYCKYKNGIQVIEPPGLDERKHVSWITACQIAENSYITMTEAGVPPQIARSVLPTCLKTEIAVTANLREWRHILALRTSKAAHPQMREVMMIAGRILKSECPNIFHDWEDDIR